MVCESKNKCKTCAIDKIETSGSYLRIYSGNLIFKLFTVANPELK